MLLIPYARLRMNTELSPAQCLEKLAPVVQPVKQGASAVIFRAKPSNGGIIFQGRVSERGFALARIERGRNSRREASPPQIRGAIRQIAGRTSLIIHVYPNWQAIILGTIAFLFWGYMAIDSTRFGLAHDVPVLASAWNWYGLYLSLIYATLLVAPVASEAGVIQGTLEQIFRNQPVKAMIR